MLQSHLPPRGRAIAVAFVLVASLVTAEIREKEKAAKPADPPAKPVAKPAPAEPDPVPTDKEDARRLEALKLRLLEWEGSAASRTFQHLELRGVLIPDATAYRTVKTYFDLRRRGSNHEQALATISKSLPRWKRFEEKAMFVVEMRNLAPKINKSDQRLYTLEGKLITKSIVITDARKRRLKAAFAGAPAGLRQAKLRVKKFWVTRDGLTRRVRRRDDPDLSDPMSIGRSAHISKPFPAYVLEAKPARLDILVSAQTVKKTRSREFVLHVNHWKKYEGPFKKDLLDLNQRRPWEEQENLELRIGLPPAGLEVPPELQALVEEVIRAGKQREGEAP